MDYLTQNLAPLAIGAIITAIVAYLTHRWTLSGSYVIQNSNLLRENSKDLVRLDGKVEALTTRLDSVIKLDRDMKAVHIKMRRIDKHLPELDLKLPLDFETNPE